MSLKDLHEAGNVTRFHTVRTSRTTTIAHHSWGVCLILLKITNPSAQLLAAAIYHDLAESVTGDVPATAKWLSDGLTDALSDMETKFEVKHNLIVDLTETEASLLKWADMLELILYADSEVAVGNTLFKPIRERGIAYLNFRTAPTAAAAIFLKELQE